MAQLRQRRVERPARHCAAHRQGQAFVQPHTLAWRSCGHHGLDNARPPGPFACASPRRQVNEKAAAAAALGRGAAIFFSGSTHSHSWHRVAVPACPASGCRAAKGGREHGIGRIVAWHATRGAQGVCQVPRQPWQEAPGGGCRWPQTPPECAGGGRRGGQCSGSAEVRNVELANLFSFSFSCDLQLRAEAACAPPRAPPQRPADRARAALYPSLGDQQCRGPGTRGAWRAALLRGRRFCAQPGQACAAPAMLGRAAPPAPPPHAHPLHSHLHHPRPPSSQTSWGPAGLARLARHHGCARARA